MTLGPVNSPDQTQSDASPTETWSVDPEGLAINLNDGYRITFENGNQAWHIVDAQGQDVRIYGDPHVEEGDGGKWDFKAQMTFQLDDGTKITVKTKPIGDGSVTVSDELIITQGDQAVHVTGISVDNVQIGSVTTDGIALDATYDDGYLAREKGGVDDWTFQEHEITYNLPFVDYATFLEGLQTAQSLPSQLTFLELPSLQSQAQALGMTDEQYLDTELDREEAALVAERDDARRKAKQATNYYSREYYENLADAYQTDLDELRAGKNTGTTQDRLNLLNRISAEVQLETKYNISITGKDTTWTEVELRTLSGQLALLPEGFTLFDPELRGIQRENFSRIAIGHNSFGVITLNGGPDVVNNPHVTQLGDSMKSVIHEIAHDLAWDIPRWDEFMAISGWQYRRDDFTEIVSTVPYGPLGTARFKGDGQVYTDGQPISLDGDAEPDGIVHVWGGSVTITAVDATFISPYAAVDAGEDFCESFSAFWQNPLQLQTQCPEKYRFMVELTGIDPLASP